MEKLIDADVEHRAALFNPCSRFGICLLMVA
jgi:hypothetical protein